MIKNLILLTILTFPLIANENISKTDLKKLSQNPTWLRLLYFNNYTNQSDVNSSEYFLSIEGKTNPLEELNATIEAYAQPFDIDTDEHPMCRFPARYMWLNKHIDLHDYKIVNPKCKKLTLSLEKTKIDSVSLMFVSGYLGNPASSFGHSFIKLNSYGKSSQTNLFDLAVSYGADVPKDENIFRYMYNGVSGGYSASITDKYFYTQDLVYGNTEFRDIWEYELRLPKDKVLFFQLHLWEILGKDFQYYFLNRNCGYEISKMLEIVTGEELVDNARVWFAPIETFHKLGEIDTTKEIIKQKIFHPSEEKKIYNMFNQLTNKEAKVAIELLKNNFEIDESKYIDLNEQEKTRLINFMISYYKYLLVKEYNNQTYKELKKKALMERFLLPAERNYEALLVEETPPDEDDKPLLFFTNYNVTNTDTGYTSIGFAPYAVQGLGKNTLNGNELIVLKTELASTGEKVFLKQFDLIKIKSFDRYQTELDNQTKVSWQIDVSVENTNISENSYNAYISGGIGKSWHPSQNIFVYVMMNSSVHTQKNFIQISPEIGMQLDFTKGKARVMFKENYSILEREFFSEVNTESLMQISKDISMYFKYNYNEKKFSEFSAGFQFFF